MLLVVDAGNTNVVFAVHDGRRWAGIWRIATEPQRTSDEALLSHSRLTTDLVGAAVIGTVVPAALYHLRRLCREWFMVEPLVARASLDWGFDIKVDNPEDVGAARLLNALAAYRYFRTALIVIDFGTGQNRRHRRAGALILRRHGNIRPDRSGFDLGRAALVGGA